MTAAGLQIAIWRVTSPHTKGMHKMQSNNTKEKTAERIALDNALDAMVAAQQSLNTGFKTLKTRIGTLRNKCKAVFDANGSWEEAKDWLEKAGLIPAFKQYANGGKEAVFQWKDREGIDFYSIASYVAKKREL